MMYLSTGKHILTGLWIAGFLTLFILITIQTVTGSVYGDRNQEAWEWLTPHLLPTIGLIVGVIVADWNRTDEVEIKGLLVIVTFVFSVAHLATLLLVILFASNKETVNETFAALKSANFPLGAIQGLVTSTMSFFFKK